MIEYYKLNGVIALVSQPLRFLTSYYILLRIYELFNLIERVVSLCMCSATGLQ